MVEATETRKTQPVWRCQVKGCTFSRPSTLHGYNQINGHQLHHAKEGLPKEERVFLLVDQNTNEVLAKTLKEAREKGLLEPGPPPPEPPNVEAEAKAKAEAEAKAKVEAEAKAKVEAEAKAKAEAEEAEAPPKAEEVAGKGKEEKEEKETTEPQVSPEGIFRYTITLPADAFTLFNMAKAADLEDADISFDVWLWDCIRKRFEKDYKMQVVLAGIAGIAEE